MTKGARFVKVGFTMTDSNADPLSKLVINTDELDRKKLSELLAGYCVISPDGSVRVDTNFIKLDAPSKILAILLAQKAAKALRLADADTLAPKHVELISGIPGGTVRRELRELYMQRLVENNNGNYNIPNHAVSRISLNIDKRTKSASKPRSTSFGSRKTRQNSEELDKLLNLDQATISEQQLNLLLSPGKYLEKSLLVLTLAREMGIESLSPNDISMFLREKIRVAVKRENVSLALGRGIRYVDRFADSKHGGYTYRIMAAGDKLLEETIQK